MSLPDIENSDALLRYLRENGHISADETPDLECLSGGVSNRTVLVRREGGADFVVKQALEKLRVAVDWRSDPCRSGREAFGLKWLTRLVPAGTVPRLLFEDPENHLLAMQAVPEPHRNWKSVLLSGEIDDNLVIEFGSLLGGIHSRALESNEALSQIFENRSFFRSLRLEPYYSFAASRNPVAMPFMQDLVNQTERICETLVHGDYSPKNVLVHAGRLVLLDHEVIHWGDPAFDLGFSITHFLGKANHCAPFRDMFLGATRAYWESYQKCAGALGNSHEFERRVVQHTLACLLARVDGRSPLEYLTDSQRQRQRTIALNLMNQSPESVNELLENVKKGLCLENGD